MNAGLILVTRSMPAGSLDPLIAAGYILDTHDVLTALPRSQLLERAGGCVAMLTTLADTIDADVLDAAGPQLRVVANCAVGYHNIDLAACHARTVTVTNTPDALTAATADFAFALLLAAARRIAEGDRLVRSRTPWQWAPTFMLGADPTGSRLGLVGLGRIGQALARRAGGFDMAVNYFKPAPAPADIEQTLGAGWMPLDELLTTSNHLIGVAIDNHEHEPAVHPRLRNHERAIQTPHLGSATESTRLQMAGLAAANILAVLRGDDPPSPVPPGDHHPDDEASTHDRSV